MKTIPVDSEEETILHLAPGTYYEKVVINRPHLCLTGQSPENTIICFDDYANKKMPDGSSYGTFRSWTMLLDASFVTLLKILRFPIPPVRERKWGRQLPSMQTEISFILETAAFSVCRIPCLPVPCRQRNGNPEVL